MTKKEFIILVLRFAGIFCLFTSVDSILNGIGTFVAMLILVMPISTPTASELITSLSLLSTSINSGINIAIVIYLIFFGKFVVNYTNKITSLELNCILQKDNYSEILIRLLGIYWLWKILCQILSLTLGTFYAWILHHPEWFSENRPSEDSSEIFANILGSILNPNLIWNRIANIVIFCLLAWYFLKKGKLIINFLSNRWLAQNNIDIQNDISTAES